MGGHRVLKHLVRVLPSCFKEPFTGLQCTVKSQSPGRQLLDDSRKQIAGFDGKNIRESTVESFNFLAV